MNGPDLARFLPRFVTFQGFAGSKISAERLDLAPILQVRDDRAARGDENPSAFCDFSRLCKEENFALRLSSCATSHNSPSPAVWDPAERIDIAPDPNVRNEPSSRGLAPHRDGAGERRSLIAAGVFGWLGTAEFHTDEVNETGRTYCVFQKVNPQKITLGREEPCSFAVTR